MYRWFVFLVVFIIHSNWSISSIAIGFQMNWCILISRHNQGEKSMHQQVSLWDLTMDQSAQVENHTGTPRTGSSRYGVCISPPIPRYRTSLDRMFGPCSVMVWDMIIIYLYRCSCSCRFQKDYCCCCCCRSGTDWLTFSATVFFLQQCKRHTMKMKAM